MSYVRHTLHSFLPVVGYDLAFVWATQPPRCYILRVTTCINLEQRFVLIVCSCVSNYLRRYV